MATFPDFPEVLTGGASETEAEAWAADALEEAVLARLAHGQAIPEPADRSAGKRILLDPVTAARALVEQRRRAQGWSKVDLAPAMGRDEKVVRRILDGRSGVTIETALEALKALGHSATLAWR